MFQLAEADLVIESASQDLTTKQKILKNTEAHVGPTTVIATNTFALRICDIAAPSRRPENVVGVHYFAPIDKSQFLEVIPHSGTSTEAIATVVNFGIKQGKFVVVVKDSPGFFTVRCLGVLISEVFQVLQVGKIFRWFAFSKKASLRESWIC